MSLISFTPLQDGVTGVNAAATNNPLNTIYNDYNGNITDANLSASAAINASKLAGGVTGMFGAWSTYTPTLAGIAIGNGTAAGRYVQIGKTTIGRILITCGSTTTMPGSGDSTFTFPATSLSTSYNDAASIIGSFLFEHVSGPTYYKGDVSWASTTTAVLLLNKVSSTDIVEKSLNTSNASVAFSAGDFIGINFVIEGA